MPATSWGHREATDCHARLKAAGPVVLKTHVATSKHAASPLLRRACCITTALLADATCCLTIGWSLQNARNVNAQWPF